MLLSEFDYSLPEELIAQEPLQDRAASRMLIVDRATGTWRDAQFREFPSYLHPGDCLIQNDSRVIPSRLFGYREGHSGRIEVFLVQPVASDGLTWKALVRPGKKMLPGARIVVPGPQEERAIEVEVLDRGEFGERLVRLQPHGDLFETLERVGHVPLPPYIHRDDANQDRDRYQTVYAREKGSVAAPTAGLHFTPQILEQCRAAGASIARVTLHVGLGTFQPLHTNVIEDVKLHSERLVVPPETLRAMDAAQRVIAIGTTSVRAMESDPAQSETSIFISPGFRFRRTQALLTNFHLPQSSLLVLVCAFGGTDLMLAAYRHAVEQRYRFFSYGDCMLIL